MDVHSEAKSGFGRRLLGVVIDAVIGVCIVIALFFALANELPGAGFKSWEIKTLGEKHYLYVKIDDTVHEVHDEEFWAVLGVALGYAVLVFGVLRFIDGWTPGRSLAGVEGRRGPSPAPFPGGPPFPGPVPGAPPPQWDPVRGTYLQWDPTGNRWLAWSDTEKQWKPIGP